MAVPLSAIKLAIFRILHDFGAELGDWDRVSRIRADWPATGLRSGDLMAGLTQLAHEHYLHMDTYHGDLFVRFDRRPPLRERLNVADHLALRQARRRVRIGPHSFERRSSGSLSAA